MTFTAPGVADTKAGLGVLAKYFPIFVIARAIVTGGFIYQLNNSIGSQVPLNRTLVSGANVGNLHGRNQPPTQLVAMNC